MKAFTPSSALLLEMIKSAEAKCDAAIEQARLRREAQEDARYAQAWINEAKARRYRVDF